MFTRYDGEVDIPTNENHRVYKWDGGNVFISAARKGNALSIHISAKGREAKRKVRKALSQFLKWAFIVFPWAEYILGAISPERKSVVNLTKKVGFKHYWDLLDGDDVKVVVVGMQRGKHEYC